MALICVVFHFSVTFSFLIQSALQEKLSTTEQNLQTQAKDSQEKIEALHKQLQEAKSLSQVGLILKLILGFIFFSCITLEGCILIQ